jgi:Xaa-Pro aminopeptidase
VAINDKQKPLSLIAVIFLASLGVASIPLLGGVARVMAAMPAIVSMVAALFQLSRDYAAHERALTLQTSQHSFALGATSHMAAVAFDKHVEFSERYLTETNETFTTLLRSSPAEEALEHAAKLNDLRRTYALWLTPTIDAALEKFEAALRRIGANAHFVNVAIDHDGRPAKIDEMFATLAEVMNTPEWDGKPVPADCGSRAVLHRLREILGTEELTRLRESLIKSALSHTL